jgi:lipoyl(octanoyl) transferase
VSGDAGARCGGEALSPPAARWRVLSDGPRDGPWNMAVDEAIAHAVGARQVPPTVRFYAWNGPTVSLGRFQDARGVVAPDARERRGIGVVRRPTGGRAVLHDDEITYSVCAPLDGAWGRGSVTESFRLIGAGLVVGLRDLGVAASLGDGGDDRSRERSAACFQGRRLPAVVADGRKLVGSAQRRWERALLQHGSLLVRVDLEMHQAVFPAWPRDEPGRGVTCLSALLPEMPARAEVEAALMGGWSEVLGVRGWSGELTAAERQEAERLAATPYADPAWTWRY